jgi:hypothetical protein
VLEFTDQSKLLLLAWEFLCSHYHTENPSWVPFGKVYSAVGGKFGQVTCIWLFTGNSGCFTPHLEAACLSAAALTHYAITSSGNHRDVTDGY